VWSRGLVVVWSCGRVVVWSCGLVVLWSCGLVVLCALPRGGRAELRDVPPLASTPRPAAAASAPGQQAEQRADTMTFDLTPCDLKVLLQGLRASWMWETLWWSTSHVVQTL